MRISIEEEMDGLIRKGGGSYSIWYVGVAADPRDRLFTGHNVDEQGGGWFFREAGSESSARDIEAIFLKKGCKGGPVGKDFRPHYIYAYKMTRTTWGSKS